MKRSILIALFSGLIGYLMYPVINPSTDNQSLVSLIRSFLDGEATRYAQARNVDEKLKAADELYEKMMILFLSQLSLEGPKNQKLIEGSITSATSDRITESIPSLPVPMEVKEAEKLTVAEKLLNDRLDLKTYLTFSGIPYISSMDSRVQRLKGEFRGKLKQKFQSRTGDDEAAVLSVNELTKFEVIDTYDNVTISYSGNTTRSFQTVQGDENLLMMGISDNRFIVLNFKSYPVIQGQLFTLNKLTANFHLKKVR